MDSNDILALVRAGFTKEEIAKMYTAEPKPKEDKKPEPEPPKQPQQKEAPPETSPLEQKMDKLLDAIANSNFLGAQQPKPETVDDIIANIINPKEG